MVSTQKKQELLARQLALYRDLPAVERELIQLIAVSHAGRHRDQRHALILRCPSATTAHKKHTWLRAAAQRWFDAGLTEAATGKVRVCAPLDEALCRQLIDDGHFAVWAARVREVLPFPDLDRYWYGGQDSGGTWELALRCAFLDNDPALAGRIMLAASRRYGEVRLDPLTWVAEPLHASFLVGLHPTLSSPLVERLGSSAFDRGDTEPGLAALIAQLSKQHRDDPGFQCAAAREQLLGGATSIKLSPQAAETATGQLLLGWACLIRGEVKRATSLFAKGLAALRKASDLKPWLSGPEALLIPLAYALHGTRTRLKQAESLCRAGDDFIVNNTQLAQARIWGEYTALLALIDGDRVGPARANTHPLSALVGGLVFRWSNRALDEAAIAAHAAHCKERGWGWLAAELGALIGKPYRIKGGVSLVSHRSAQSDWERQLDALERLLPGPGSKARKAAGPSHRVAWELQYGDDWLELTAFQQSRKGGGDWSSGRAVAMSRLATKTASIKGLTDEDLRVAACLKVSRNSGWSGYAEYDYSWPPLLTWNALVDHPAVFGPGERTTPLAVTKRAPRLVVSRDSANKLRIYLDPSIPTDGFSVVEVAPHRLEVVTLNPAQRKIASQLGRGLVVPAAAKARIGAFTSRLAGVFDLADEAGAAPAETRAPDGRLIVRLHPVDDGLRAQVVVRPFGESGPSFGAGRGPKALLDQVDGRLCRTERDLPGEAAALSRLYRQIPALSWAEDGPTSLEEALELLEGLQAVDDILLEWPKGEALRVVTAPPRSVSMSVKGSTDWFAASGSLKVGDDLVLQLTELIERVDASDMRFIRLDDGRFLALTERLKERLEHLGRVGQRKGDELRIHPLATPLLDRVLDEAGRTRIVKAYKTHRAKMDADPEQAPIPRTLKAELRPYQEDGFRWAARLAELGIGGCLADDMGLGKTVQALALLLHRAANGPALVVAPTSVCGTWQREAWRFAPTLTVHRFGDGDRQEQLDALGPGHLLICSYGLLVSESERLSPIAWDTLIVDESQAVKNERTRRWAAVQQLTTRAKLFLTGTPIENHLGELWAQFALLNPGFLGTEAHFRRRFSTPIEKGSRHVGGQLRRLVAPFILRRTKSAVLQDLPPKTDITLPIELSQPEAALYESLRRQALERLGNAENPLQVLAQLTRLRLACCNPALVLPDGAPSSTKLAAFIELIKTLRAENHRALVFSQFVRHLTLIREALVAEGIEALYLDGSTPAKERDRLVDAFQAGQGDLFLISLRAGGTGLNLTAADYVIHMDPWWNPAVEDQASDRAHRIGQTRPVTVYRLVAAGTIEEQIVELHHKKRDLADRLLASTDTAPRLSTEDLLWLLRGG